MLGQFKSLIIWRSFESISKGDLLISSAVSQSTSVCMLASTVLELVLSLMPSSHYWNKALMFFKCKIADNSPRSGANAAVRDDHYGWTLQRHNVRAHWCLADACKISSKLNIWSCREQVRGTCSWATANGNSHSFPLCRSSLNPALNMHLFIETVQ